MFFLSEIHNLRFCFIFKFDLDVHQGDALVVKKQRPGRQYWERLGEVHTVQVESWSFSWVGIQDKAYTEKSISEHIKKKDRLAFRPKI